MNTVVKLPVKTKMMTSIEKRIKDLKNNSQIETMMKPSESLRQIKALTSRPSYNILNKSGSNFNKISRNKNNMASIETIIRNR